MSLYSHYLLPRLIDAAMGHQEVSRIRARMIPAAAGVVLEVGIGSGLNLPYYGPAVARLHGVDTSAELLAMARSRAQAAPFPVELRRESAELMSLADTSVDTVVITWSLCSIPNPLAALREMKRVLKPDGALIFVEHGLSSDARVRSWQNRLTPLWRHLAGGCHLNRKMDDLIGAGGFRISELATEYIPGPRFATYIYLGTGIPKQ